MWDQIVAGRHAFQGIEDPERLKKKKILPWLVWLSSLRAGL